MAGTVKITPSAFQIIALHCGIDSTREMKGILIGKIIFPDVFVVTAIPLSKSQKHDVNAINCKCERISRILGTTYSQVGWYHSHSEVGPNLTEEDVQLHLKFQTKFPNSIALVLQGCKNIEELPVGLIKVDLPYFFTLFFILCYQGKMSSFAAFRCIPDGAVVSIPCQVRPLVPTANASKFYQTSLMALKDILQVIKEYIDENNDQPRDMDKALLQPLILTLQSMHSALHHLRQE